jgi:hypothetical protein
MIFSRILATLGLAVYLTACIYWAIRLSEKPTPGSVEGQWSNNIRELGISPVFPPREDVQVGDIYLVTNHAQDNGRANSDGPQTPPFWLGNIGSEQLVADLYKNRFALLPEQSSPENGRMWPFVENKGGVFRLGSDATRLKNVSFPGFTAASIRSAELAISHPFAAFLNSVFGIGGERSYTITVNIPYAESYGVPALDVLKQIDQYCPSSTEDFHKRVKTLESIAKAKMQTGFTIDVVTELFFARAIDYTIAFRSGGGGEVSVTGATIEDLKKQVTDLGKSLAARSEAGKASTKAADASEARSEKVVAGDAPNVAPTSPAPPELTQLEDIKGKLDRLMRKLDTASVPGASGSVFSADSRSVTLRQTFADPVVIGYRGLTFAADSGQAAPGQAASGQAASGQAASGQGASEQASAGTLPLFEPCRTTSFRKFDEAKGPGRLRYTYLIFLSGTNTTLRRRVRRKSNWRLINIITPVPRYGSKSPATPISRVRCSITRRFPSGVLTK